MIRISQLKLPVKHDKEMIEAKLCKSLNISNKDIIDYKIYRRSLDARKKNDIHYSYIIDVNVVREEVTLLKNKKAQKVDEFIYEYPEVNRKQDSCPIIVGFGPAGLFAAYILAELGLKPIVFERGEDVDNRTKTVEEFWSKGILNENSNVQFGEGGAGAFSDGKLTTRSKDLRARKVLEILVKHGAPEEILYVNKPHVGTDVLKPIVKSMREEIIRLGGEVNFNTVISDFVMKNQQVKGVICKDGTVFESDSIILAVGHSARDTYEQLYQIDVSIEQKSFAMGVRIEHHQSTINKNQYGDEKLGEIIGASDYKLTHKTSNGRSVYSFCVCPGGMVVASSSEKGGLVINGMSEHSRDQKNINSALLVQVDTSDFESNHPLSGIEFQRKYERLAFEVGGGNYNAPAESVGSFLRGEKNYHTNIIPTYRPNIKYTNLYRCLPEFVVSSLKEGLINFGGKIEGFSGSSSILTGIETRSSAPIRILRDFDTMASTSTKGLYPIGEGSGYAGGIISSAIDGIKVAEIIAKS